MIAEAKKNNKTPCGNNSAEDSAGKMPASRMPTVQRGSVLVIGGGIAGMQAALDCANSGFKVHLVEQQPAIGGNMARLDKTFPTNDCAMCMLSPKLVEVGRHLNIDIISYADVEKIEGQAGDFNVTVKKHARFVDEELCNGCGDCAEACPVHMKDLFNGELAERKAIYRLYPQAIPNVFTIDKRELPPPCRATCPAGVNAQGYVALIAKGKFLEALDVVRERMPFAGTCGRICHHPCENNCNRAQIDAAVSVRNLKRFVADYEHDKLLKGESIERPPSERVKPEKHDYTEKIAIIGGGPAGLACAYDLALKGYTPTIFEASQELGGMMRSGIPAYRLPRDYLDFEIKLLLNEGIEVRTGKALGRDMQLADLKTQGYKSVFIAMGAALARKIPLEGRESKGVLYGMDFLREVNAGGKPPLGKNVIVIGGGNVAMDVARSALRVSPDSNVSLYCLESGPEMPAHEWEIKEAIDEGVRMNPSWGPSEVVSKNDQAVALELTRCTRVFNEEGKFAPQFDATQKQTVKVDTIILAVGQACDLSSIENALTCERGVIKSDPLTLQTSRDGIFAGGDIVLGPASLVEAVAQGHRAAESIHRYLRGQDIAADREPVERPTEFAGMPQQGIWSNAQRHDMPQASADTRTRGFVEIDSGYTEEMAIAEASRCLNCGGCSVCRECVRVCKTHAINHDMQDKQLSLNVGAVIYAGGYDVFDARRKSEYGFGRFPNVV
ncbi:MAG: FAD-dependent oxidoreductase, partial [Sedimentisphaerales bacterium]|nr:FAD-dependent oxidoreductase [Sedimentisphaerales bacterium]